MRIPVALNIALMGFSLTCDIVLLQVDLRHMDEKTGSNVVDVGVDLSEFYMSVEWDILEVPAVRYGLAS